MTAREGDTVFDEDRVRFKQAAAPGWKLTRKPGDPGPEQRRWVAVKLVRNGVRYESSQESLEALIDRTHWRDEYDARRRQPIASKPKPEDPRPSQPHAQRRIMAAVQAVVLTPLDTVEPNMEEVRA